MGFAHEFKNLEWNGGFAHEFKNSEWNGGFAHEFKNSEWKWNLPTSFATQNGKGICQQVLQLEMEKEIWL